VVSAPSKKGNAHEIGQLERNGRERASGTDIPKETYTTHAEQK
jgi:hypothetical protein